MASLSEIMSEQLIEDMEKVEDLEKDEDFEKALQESEMVSNSPKLEHVDDSDEALARQLQESFDEEYAHSLDAKQPVVHGNGKVACVSYSSKGVKSSESVEDGEDTQDWTNFVRRYRDGTPMLFSNLDENGELITKHNPLVCGMRNANLVEKFVENSGNMDGHVLSNEVIGSLKNTRKMTHKK